jgi:hypothetical protein
MLLTLVIVVSLFGCEGPNPECLFYNSLGECIEYAQIEDNGDFIVIAQDSRYNQGYKQVLGELGQISASALNDLLKLPNGNIMVSFEDCGQANAFYDPQNVRLIMCYELFTEFLSSSGYTFEPAAKAYMFVFFHEAGHALVDQLELPVLGKEEDSVDAMATVIMVNADMPESAILAGFFFNNQQQGTQQVNWFDSHSVGPQRIGNLVCWAIGGDSDLLLKNPGLMDLAQQIIAVGQRDCKAEYQQQEKAVEELWEPYIKY